MKRDKFLYELVDNYLYAVNLSSMVMENYLMTDRTQDYINCADCLEDCLDFYEQLDTQLGDEMYQSHEVDAILTYLVMSLKEQTLQTFYRDLSYIIKETLPEKTDFLQKNLLFDEKGKPQEPTTTALLNFLKVLREAEVSCGTDIR